MNILEPLFKELLILMNVSPRQNNCLFYFIFFLLCWASTRLAMNVFAAASAVACINKNDWPSQPTYEKSNQTMSFSLAEDKEKKFWCIQSKSMIRLGSWVASQQYWWRNAAVVVPSSWTLWLLWSWSWSWLLQLMKDSILKFVARKRSWLICLNCGLENGRAGVWCPQIILQGKRKFNVPMRMVQFPTLKFALG